MKKKTDLDRDMKQERIYIFTMAYILTRMLNHIFSCLLQTRMWGPPSCHLHLPSLFDSFIQNNLDTDTVPKQLRRLHDSQSNFAALWTQDKEATKMSSGLKSILVNAYHWLVSKTLATRTKSAYAPILGRLHGRWYCIRIPTRWTLV